MNVRIEHRSDLLLDSALPAETGGTGLPRCSVVALTCQFCGKDPGVWRDCCREMRVQLFREQSAEYKRGRAAYAVECAAEDERIVAS